MAKFSTGKNKSQPGIRLSPIIKPEPSIPLNPARKEPSTKLSNFPLTTLLKNGAVTPIRQTPTTPINPFGFPNVIQQTPQLQTPKLGGIFDTTDPETGQPDYLRGFNPDILGQVKTLVSEHQTDAIVGIVGLLMIGVSLVQIVKPL